MDIYRELQNTKKMSESSRKKRAVGILRAFQVYYLAFFCFLAAYGELVSCWRISLGHKLESLIILPLVVAIIIIILEKNLKLKFTWREGLLASFVVFGAFGLIYSPFPRVVRKGLIQVVTAAFLYFLLLHAARTKRDYMAFTSFFIAGSVLTAVIGVVNYFSQGTAWAGAWGHNNIFGAFLRMPIALTLALAIFYLRKWRILLLLIPALALELLALYLSQSRGAWLACAVIVLAVGILGGKKGFAITALIIVIGITALFTFPTERVATFGIKGLVKQKFFGRDKYIWPEAASMIKERPILGYGLNTYRDAYAAKHGIEKPDYSKVADLDERAKLQWSYNKKIKGNVHPHNELMQAWVGMGLAGIFFYGALFVVILVTYIKMRRLKADAFSSAIALGVFAWYVGHIVHGFVDCFFFFRHAFASAAVMLALMFGLYYSNIRSRAVDSTQEKSLN